MAVRTRRKCSLYPPNYDSPTKVRFFKAWDEREPGQSLRAFTAQCTPSKSTAARWLQERDNIGSPTGRKARKRSTRLSRRSKLSKDTCKILISPSRNRVRDQHLDTQIAFYNLPIKARQLTRKLKEHTK